MLLVLGGIAYPVCVFFFYDEVPFWCFPVVALILLFFRWQSIGRKVGKKGGLLSLGGALALILLFATLHPHLVAQAYPVVVSLLFAFLFGFSLLFPPTVVERIARIKTPELSEAGVRYTRRVTWIWFWFLVLNAGIAYGLALAGELRFWMLWTSFYSYVGMGCLFVGEFAFRKLKGLEAS